MIYPSKPFIIELGIWLMEVELWIFMQEILGLILLTSTLLNSNIFKYENDKNTYEHLYKFT